MIRIFLFFSFLLLLASCTHNSGSISANQDNTDSKVTLGPQQIAVSSATPEQCPAGGSVFFVYHDQNGDSHYDPSDILMSTQVVCNGVSGTQGHSALVYTSRVSLGLTACSSGSGLQINAGLDINDNGILDPSEISNPQVVCDGSNGLAGSSGLNMVFQSVPASQADCSAGGSTIIMALDSDRSGGISPADQNYQSLTLCNGQNGQDAAPTNYTPVEPILACGSQVAYKEVLLRLSNGQVLGSFSEDVNGKMTRLSFLPDGTYMNTDSSGCVFSLSTSVDLSTRYVSWFGQVQMSWPLY